MLRIIGSEEQAKSLIALLNKKASLPLVLGGSGYVLQEESDQEEGGSDGEGEVLGEENDDEEVVEDKPVRTPHDLLLRVIEDYKTVEVVIKDTAVHFGKFGDQQWLGLANILGIEKGVEGLGAAIAFHEIWENYVSQLPGDSRSDYGSAHQKAIELESIITPQLVGKPGSRVAAGGTKEGRRGYGYILDMERYFVMLTPRPEEKEWEEKGRFIAKIHERTELGSFSLTVSSAERVDPVLIQGVVSTMQQEPTATARITALRRAGESDADAGARARAVRNALIVGLTKRRLRGTARLPLRDHDV